MPVLVTWDLEMVSLVFIRVHCRLNLLLLGIKAGFLCRTHSNWNDLAGFFFNVKFLEKSKTLDLSKNQNLGNVFTQDTKLTGLSGKFVLQRYAK